MSKKNEDRRNQPEFFFVFDSEGKTQSSAHHTLSSKGASERQALSPEVVKTHRDRLIEEVREFGC